MSRSLPGVTFARTRVEGKSFQMGTGLAVSQLVLATATKPHTLGASTTHTDFSQFWRMESKVLAWADSRSVKGSDTVSSLGVLTVEGWRELSPFKDTNPTIWPPSSRPNHLPMSPPPCTITLGDSFQCMDLGGQIQSLRVFSEWHFWRLLPPHHLPGSTSLSRPIRNLETPASVKQERNKAARESKWP